MLPESTVRCIHDITGEVTWPATRTARMIRRVEASLDWTLWIRRVDVALIGGDPVILAARLETLARQCNFRAPMRIAVLHPGSFSGAPLALLSDADIRRRLALPDPAAQAIDPAAATVRSVIERMSPIAKARFGAGVRAFDMVQGCRDSKRGETVLRLTRDRMSPRLSGRALSDAPKPQICGSDTPLGGGLYARSETLFEEGLGMLWRHLPGGFKEPPGGFRYADVVVARRVEVLSGFISSPAVVGDGVQNDEDCSAISYLLARAAPACVDDALEMWAQDLALAREGPIFV